MRSFLFILAFTATFLAVFANENYYAILGIDKRSTEKEIRSAYRKLSLKYHPDKNPGDQEAHDKFIQVGEAYEVLNNPEKRANYDKYGSPDGPQQPHGGFGDMFDHFFHGHAGHAQQEQKGPNAQLNLIIPLSDFYNGNLVEFDVEMVDLCLACDHTGSQDKKTHTCEKCQGMGQVITQRQMGPMIQRIQHQCDECHGRGHKITHPCKVCGGQGSLKSPRHYDVYVTPGLERNSEVVLSGEADKRPGIIPGDLVIHFKEDLTKSWGFRRVKQNLYRTEVLTLKEAENGGWERIIPFFGQESYDEHRIVLKRGAGQIVRDGEVEVLEGRGMPIVLDHDDLFGNMYIEYKVLIPDGKVMEHDEL